MTDIAQWPATLPEPRADGYGLQRKASYTPTDMDSGETRTRRRFTSTPSSVTVKWRFTHAQLAVLDGFLAYEINDGAAPFMVGLLNGLGIVQMRAKFVDDPPYQASISDSRAWFDVTATLQVRRMPVVSLDEYQMLSIYSENEIGVMSDKLHTLIHVQLPGPARWD